jgi:hypothetical protein
MARFIQTEIATTRQADRRQESPSLVAYGPALDALLGKSSPLRPHVVAHQIELLLAAGPGRVASHFGRWCGEDKPSLTRINPGKANYVAEKSPIGRGVTAVDDRVHA